MLSGSNILEKFPENIKQGEDVTDYIEHIREYTVTEMIDYLKEVGFTIQKIIMYNRPFQNRVTAKYCPPLLNEIMTIHAIKTD